jgi:hypothetical protein
MTGLQTRVTPQAKSEAITLTTSTTLLERRCPCGGVAGIAGECAGCRAKRLACEARSSAAAESVPAAAERPPTHSLSTIRPHDPARAADSRAQDGAGLAQTLLRLHAAEKATDSPDDEERDPEVLLQANNGETTCTLPGGTPSTTIFNTACSGPCTERHEGVHRGDISACCASAGTAYTAAKTDAARNTVRTRFFTWMGANVPWFECRAYGESVTCADGLISAKHCGTPTMAPADSACCTELTSYRADKEARRASNCASAAASLTACPFP